MPAKQPASTPAQDCAEMLRQLFETSEVSRKAATSLSRAASVGVRFTNVPGDFRFHSVDGKPRFEPGKLGSGQRAVSVEERPMSERNSNGLRSTATHLPR